MAFKVIAGLGNPGPGYERTRHNVGFLLLDKLVAGGWRKKFNAEISEIQLAGEAVLVVKPQTFMNRSGEPLRAIMEFYKRDISELIVTHDEVDLPLGTIRVKQGGGAAGHNGIKSLVTELGSADFVRVRLGVGRPPITKDNSGAEVERALADWVLGRFETEAFPAVEQMLDRGVLALQTLMSEGLKIAQNKFN